MKEIAKKEIPTIQNVSTGSARKGHKTHSPID